MLQWMDAKGETLDSRSRHNGVDLNEYGEVSADYHRHTLSRSHREIKLIRNVADAVEEWEGNKGEENPTKTAY